MTLNWRKSPVDDNLIVDLEDLYRIDPDGKYLEVLGVLKKSGSYGSFESTIPYIFMILMFMRSSHRIESI